MFCILSCICEFHSEYYMGEMKFLFAWRKIFHLFAALTHEIFLFMKYYSSWEEKWPFYVLFIISINTQEISNHFAFTAKGAWWLGNHSNDDLFKCEVLKMLPSACSLGQHFQVRSHSFSQCGPTLNQYTVNKLFIFSKLSNEKKLTEKNSRKRYCDHGQR